MSVNSKMTAIADAIRGKTGGTAVLTLGAMAVAINEIDTSGVAISNQDITITENGTYSADEGYTGLGTVVVDVEAEAVGGNPLEMEEKELSFTQLAEDEPFVSVDFGLAEIKEGATYDVSWDGTVYTCKALRFDVDEGKYIIMMGSMAILGMPDGVPFVIMYDPMGAMGSPFNMMMMSMYDEEETTHTVAVKLNFASGANALEMEEKELPFADSGDGLFVSSSLDITELKEDATYDVTWDGTVYTCTAQRVDMGEGYYSIILGNPMFFTGETDDTPFVIIHDASDTGFIMIAAMFDTEATTHTVGIEFNFTAGGGTGGDESGAIDALIDKSITEVSSSAESVGKYAFYECSNLTTADFPKATSIGTFAFYNCSKLTAVDSPIATSVGTNAFVNCSALTIINFPKVTSISNFVFYNCKALETAKFPLVTSIGTYAFQECSNLTTADFPSVTSVGDSAFVACKALTTVVLRSETVATLANANAFANTPIAEGTGYIFVPRALIGEYKTATNWSTYSSQLRAIEDCSVDGTITGELDLNKPKPQYYTIRFLNGATVLQSIQVAEGNMPVYEGDEPTESGFVFDGWEPEIVTVTGDADYQVKWELVETISRTLINKTIKEAENEEITQIGNGAFRACSTLGAVDLPLVTSVGDYAFYDCASLKTANLPSATNFGTYAFRNCSKLTTADFPKATSIGTFALYQCKALTTVVLRSETMATLAATNALASTPIASGTGYIYVPRALVDSYKSATNWSTYANQFRALEDWTVDGTISGELDWARINEA